MLGLLQYVVADTATNGLLLRDAICPWMQSCRAIFTLGKGIAPVVERDGVETFKAWESSRVGCGNGT